MSATVSRPDGSVKLVKNLGYLLQNWKGIKSVEAHLPRAYEDTKLLRPDAMLVVHFHDGRLYETPFASKEVLKDWLHRPVLRGLPLKWFGQDTVC